MTIAVAASTGQLGRAVLDALRELDPGRPLVGLARSPEKGDAPGVDYRAGDYDAPDALRASLEGVEALLLISGNGDPEARIQQHRNVLDAARAAGVRRVVYTSIQGAEEGTAFSPVVRSNRRTEEDVRACGMEWAIGRNGIYIEPDLDYADTYRERGEIANCAGDGRCGYATRQELAHAYARLLTEPRLSGGVFNLHGEAITQTQLAAHFSRAFGARIVYREMSVADYRADRAAELGPFIGGIVAGIYEGIRMGAMDNPSDFETVAGRPHRSWTSVFDSIRP